MSLFFFFAKSAVDMNAKIYAICANNAECRIFFLTLRVKCDIIIIGDFSEKSRCFLWFVLDLEKCVKDVVKMNKFTMKDLFRLLLGKIWLILFFMIIGGAAAFAYTKFMVPLEYSSRVSMYVQSYYGVTDDSSGMNNISNSKSLVNTYTEVLKDDAVMNAVGDILMTQFDEGTLQKCYVMNDHRLAPSSLSNSLSINTVPDTSALKLVVTTKDPEVAAYFLNDLTSVAPKFVKEAVGVGQINTIDKARVEADPVAPNVKFNTLFGAVAAAFVIICIIILIDFFDNTVKDSDELSKRYKKPIIGEVQSYGEIRNKNGKKRRKDSDSRILISQKNIPFNIKESFISIRTNIDFAIGTSQKRILAVTSPNPGDGKSTTASNIAVAFAQNNDKVLLIDADMRKPVQHRAFGIKNSEGLSKLIINKATFSKSKETVMDKLDLIPSGPTPPNPSVLLASKQFKDLLERFSEYYDYIIIDTPPVNVVSDAMVLKDSVDGVLLVLKHGSTTFDDVDKCMKQIELANANMIGFVFNDVENKHRSGYGSKYRNYDYGYGDSAKRARKGEI